MDKRSKVRGELASDFPFQHRSTGNTTRNLYATPPVMWPCMQATWSAPRLMQIRPVHISLLEPAPSKAQLDKTTELENDKETSTTAEKDHKEHPAAAIAAWFLELPAPSTMIA
ncbi:Ribonuclease H [Fusarium albosuccineum]|uniref:Ribonuclease H n=1 Tax=Fusarium albosuccineum TaxID=1237068 RepID=A0A8H4KZK5_9HYPO|nr:Ribonuclease H [Fusarium albosuccineum]